MPDHRGHGTGETPPVACRSRPCSRLRTHSRLFVEMARRRLGVGDERNVSPVGQIGSTEHTGQAGPIASRRRRSSGQIS